MELIRGIYNLGRCHKNCVATIGNFDGVHLGHQRLFQQLQESARKRNLPSCIVTFDPLPHEYFSRKEDIQSRLTYFREKIHAIAAFNPDRILLLRFNDTLANLSADSFVQDVLVKGLRVHHLIVGDDFRFGRHRHGDFQLLQAAAEQFDFSVSPTETFRVDDKRVSSTRIREYLKSGSLTQAAKLLGRPYSMEGRVVHGKQLGRTLGYPTANILLKRHKAAVHGIFVAQVTTENQMTYQAMASLGERPTVDGGGETLLEVHLLDFDRDLYKQHLKTVFLHKIRDEEKFSSLEQLTDAIGADETLTRDWFKQN